MKENIITTDSENNTLKRLKKNNESEIAEWIAGNKKLLSIIGHDIKSPMSSIVSFLRLIEEKVYEWDRDKIKKNVGFTLYAAEKSIYLLESILDWAMAVNMSKTFRPERIDINKILEIEIENLLVFALPKKIKIISLIASKYEVYADKNMTMSIFRNLLNNAIKYSYKGGKIEISAKENNGFIEIKVKDYGKGIPQDLVETLLNSDNNNSELGTYNEPGTGFGLLLCKEFVDIHNGNIWIVSKPGIGSEFIFALPVVKKQQINKIS